MYYDVVERKGGRLGGAGAVTGLPDNSTKKTSKIVCFHLLSTTGMYLCISLLFIAICITFKNKNYCILSKCCCCSSIWQSCQQQHRFYLYLLYPQPAGVLLVLSHISWTWDAELIGSVQTCLPPPRPYSPRQKKNKTGRLIKAFLKKYVTYKYMVLIRIWWMGSYGIG